MALLDEYPWRADFLRWSNSVPMGGVEWPVFARADVRVIVRRDDLLHPLISGNKAYKLLGHLERARRQGAGTLVSFGGAYSNHLHALASASNRYGFKSVGIIRGERPPVLSPTLNDVEALGMTLHFISRKAYASLAVEALLATLRELYGDIHVIPEGGGGDEGTEGLALCLQAIDSRVDNAPASICMASGTGTTLAGLARHASGAKFRKTVFMGFSVLKGDGNLGANIRKLTVLSHDSCDMIQPCLPMQTSKPEAQWRLVHGFHGGGYAKPPKGALLAFWKDFEQTTGIPLDPVYTLKLFWGMSRLAHQGYWPQGATVVAIHSGGLQGRRGFTCPEL